MSNYNPFSLEGKTVLVTGASSGIGKATAIECSKMGAKLVITGRNAERLQQTFTQLEGDGHLQFTAELTSGADLLNLVEISPQLNGLVLCAGKGLTLPFQFCTREKFNMVFDVNFFSPVELARLFFKKKKINNLGSVVVVSSIGGNFSHAVANSVYGASKAALTTIMKYCAKEFAARKIRVNGVNPGMVNTPLIHGDKITAEQLEIDKARYPLGRYGQPNDIAHGIIYLLSDASSWVTGHSLVIDGGVTI